MRQNKNDKSYFQPLSNMYMQTIIPFSFYPVALVMISSPHSQCQTWGCGCCCSKNRVHLHHPGFLQSWSSSHSGDGLAQGPDASGSSLNPIGAKIQSWFGNCLTVRCKIRLLFNHQPSKHIHQGCALLRMELRDLNSKLISCIWNIGHTLD